MVQSSQAAATTDPDSSRNLPVPVQQGELLQPAREAWLMRAMRSLFGWKSNSARADLKVVLEAEPTGETSISMIERTMLRNILELHEQRIVDVMVPRADIIAVKRDISLGELMSLFESAAHSRLVVFNETLDDPEGMVHIRDLIAFMTAGAYGAAMSSTYNARLLVPEVLVKGSAYAVVRPRQTWEELIGQDRLPDWE